MTNLGAVDFLSIIGYLPKYYWILCLLLLLAVFLQTIVVVSSEKVMIYRGNLLIYAVKPKKNGRYGGESFFFVTFAQFWVSCADVFLREIILGCKSCSRFLVKIEKQI